MIKTNFSEIDVCLKEVKEIIDKICDVFSIKDESSKRRRNCIIIA